MQYARIFTDESGESHFEEVEVEFGEVDYAPPAPPLLISEMVAARGTAFLAADPGRGGDEWHPTPVRQDMVGVAGRFEVTASDGEKRAFGRGDVLLLEDDTGRGHATEIVGDERVVVAVIQLAG